MSEKIIRLMPNRKLWVAIIVAFVTNVVVTYVGEDQASAMGPMIDQAVSLLVGLVAGYFTKNAATDALDTA